MQDRSSLPGSFVYRFISILSNYYLPTASYWSIVDLDTNEVVIDFDSTYTKISADSTSNYFDVYMNGLEPERYYKILNSKRLIDGSN
jgi:hypothetical protein